MNRLAAFLVTLSRQLFWVAAFGLILAALYVSLGRQLVPLVAEYRTELQERCAPPRYAGDIGAPGRALGGSCAAPAGA